MKTRIALTSAGLAAVALLAGCQTPENPKADLAARDTAADSSKPAAKTPAKAAVKTPVKPVAKKPAVPTKPNDKGWVLQSFRWNCDVLGQLSGRARITNTNDSAKTGTFTISLFKAGAEVGSLEGAANGTDSGKTVTVDLISMDPCLKGTFKYDFQTDVSY